MSTKVLPDKLSDLLELALADLEKAEADPVCVVEMESQFYGESEAQCHVCLGGGLLRYSLAMAGPKVVMHQTVGEDIAQKCYAVDSLRGGAIRQACIDIGIAFPKGAPKRASVTPYDEDPDAFKADMRRIVTLLREHGL